MRQLAAILLFLSFSLTGRAQLLDTLRSLLKQEHSIDLRLESRASFIENQLTSISGVRIGLSFQRKLRLGAGVSWLTTNGYNWLKTNVTRDFPVQGPDGRINHVQKYLKFVYACYYLDFVFYKTQHWQLSVPIQVGTGCLWYQYNKNYSFGNKEPKYLLLLYEPGITLQYKIFKWLGFGSDVTYRFAFQNAEKTGVHLSNVSFTLKSSLDFDFLFYELFPKSPITRKFGPAYW